jgi:hypothetical protein
MPGVAAPAAPAAEGTTGFLMSPGFEPTMLADVLQHIATLL